MPSPKRGIFISYRRDDAAGEAGRLSDHLLAMVGAESVFLDVNSIVPGDDWRQRLDGALDHCDTMLVVIGRQWLTGASTNHPALRRLDETGDMVAWEVARGLTRGLRMIQVLVQKTAPLVAEQLPSTLAALAMRQAFVIKHESFAADVRELVRQIKVSRRASTIFKADWVASDLVKWTRVLDSGVDSTAAAITIVNALEILVARSGARRNLSVRYLYEKAIRHQARSDLGGIFLLPALFVASFFGVPEEHVWPYRPGNRKLPKGKTWTSLEKDLGPTYQGDFFKVDGLTDAVRQLAAGRPVIATVEIKGGTWFEAPCMKTGEVPMPPQESSSIGRTTVLLTGFDPGARRFRFQGTWGVAWGDKGFGTMTLDIARIVVDPEGMWSAQLSRSTVAELLEAKLEAAAKKSRRDK